MKKTFNDCYDQNYLEEEGESSGWSRRGGVETRRGDVETRRGDVETRRGDVLIPSVQLVSDSDPNIKAAGD